jgi:hypothetical protein
MESLKLEDGKSIKCRDSVLQRHLLKTTQQGASQSGEPPQGTGTPRKPRDLEFLTRSTASPSGLTEQGASTDKPAEEDTVVQKVPLARTTPPLGGDLKRLGQGEVVPEA